MKSDYQWTSRVERQPHRDAVRRLRKAYGLLWWMSQPTSITSEANEKVKKTQHFAQEVQK